MQDRIGQSIYMYILHSEQKREIIGNIIMEYQKIINSKAVR